MFCCESHAEPILNTGDYQEAPVIQLMLYVHSTWLADWHFIVIECGTALFWYPTLCHAIIIFRDVFGRTWQCGADWWQFTSDLHFVHLHTVVGYVMTVDPLFWKSPKTTEFSINAWNITTFLLNITAGYWHYFLPWCEPLV
jgi:hypothetical protein